MAATQPIRSKEKLKELTVYYLEKGELRNYTLVVMGVYTALGINDLLRLKWEDIYDDERQLFYYMHCIHYIGQKISLGTSYKVLK